MQTSCRTYCRRSSFFIINARVIIALTTFCSYIHRHLRCHCISSISNVCICPQFNCCGGVTYTDWSKNMYFNCNKDNPSRERCSVPFSCCVISKDKVVFLYRLYWKVSVFFMLCFVYLYLYVFLYSDGRQHYVWPWHARTGLWWSWKPHPHQRLHRQIG